MIIRREWAMPNKNTFSIKPIRSLINKYINNKKVIIDPFANNSKIATITNDLDKQYNTDYHLDALEFLKMFPDESVDVVLYDPPYSPRQITESYKRFNMAVNMQTTQASYWSKQKNEIARIINAGGICLSCGWNSNGIGKKRGFILEELLIVAHGGNHNDTLVLVERNSIKHILSHKYKRIK